MIVLVELVEQVGVGRQRHRRRVPGLTCDLDHGCDLSDQEADEAVSQVIGPRVRNLGVLGSTQSLRRPRNVGSDRGRDPDVGR